jgi:hypothetical protein
VSHFCTPLPEHVDVPGVHVPAHAPIAHTPTVQATGLSHAPFEHVCTPPVVEHCVLMSEHTPHTPAPLQKGVAAGQAAAAPHDPFVAQVSTPLPEHLCCCGLHMPWHVPATHAWLVHAAPMSCHWPATQLCGCCPLHRRAPAEHGPASRVDVTPVSDGPPVPSLPERPSITLAPSPIVASASPIAASALSIVASGEPP